jgi:hypothetical protein
MKSLSRPTGSRAVFSLAFSIVLISGLFAIGPIAATAQTAVSQCNGTDNVGGQAVECHYTVTNTIDGATTSSTVTLTECHGAANDPATLVCSTSTVTSTDLVTSVDQCNGSGNGGGGTVECTVDVINNITGVVAPTSATVNQCNASGEGGGTAPTVLCDPFPANTTSATVTQCNESGNGGGGTQRVRCTVGSNSTTTALLTVTVNQCNGSGNGGGATVVCSTSLTNFITAPQVQPTASPAPIETPGPGPTSTPGPGPTSIPTASPLPIETPGPEPTSNPTENPGLDENAAGPGGSGGGPTVQGGSPGGGSDIETGQVTRIPTGGAAAGGGSTSGIENVLLLALGSLFLLAAAYSLRIRRRIALEP